MMYQTSFSRRRILMSDKRHTARRTHTATPSSLPRSIAIGLAVTLLSSPALLLIFTAIVYATPDPGKLVHVAALAALYIACFAGSMTSVLTSGGELSSGLIGGGIFWLILLVASLLVPGGTSWLSVGLHSICLAFSAAGAFSAASLSAHQRSSRTRRRTR